mgnify:CR=1 FL=1
MSDTAALQAAWQDAAEEVAGIGFWRMDPSTGAVDWSPNMFRLFEFPVGPAPNAQETMSRIHPDDRADAYIDLSSNLQAGGHVSISRIMLPSGGIRATVRQSLVAHGGGSGGIRVYGQPGQRNITGKGVHLLD